MQEEALPGHLDAIAYQHRVGLIEAETERIIRFLADAAFVGLARPERDAGRIDRQRAGDAFAARFSSIDVRLPIQTSSANTAPVASIFIPEMVTPSSASAMTRRVGSSRASPVKISRLRMPAGGVTANEI